MLPFEGLKILDFSQRLPGPYCSSVLADLGAEVIMVERAGQVPETRNVFPGLFELVNRNKKSITLNLKSDAGRALARKLIGRSHVLIEEFRPGVAERLGIGYSQVKEFHPSIVYCSISGFGQNGPYRDRVGHDINYLSLSGIMSIPGQMGIPPSRPGVPIVDLTSGIFAAFAIVAALWKREKKGMGEYIDLSMFDVMFSWMSVRAGSYLVYGKETKNDHLSALNSIYETQDKRKISLGIIEPHFWKNFCKAAEREDLLVDPRFKSVSDRNTHADELAATMKDLISTHTYAEWDRRLNWTEVPFAPVYAMEEAINDAHVSARGLLNEIEAAELGKIKEVAFPAKFKGIKPKAMTPPPRWGEHTEDILRELAYTPDEIRSLKKKKVI